MPIAEGDAQQAQVEMPSDPDPRPPVFRCICGVTIEYGWEPLAVTTALDAVAEHVRFDCPKVQRAAPPPKWPGSPEAMTLGELDRMAARFGAAVATIKEAQALLGAPLAGPATLTAPVQALPPAPVSRIPERPPSRIDPEAQAELDAFRLSQERGRLIEQNRDNPANFPPSIANAMRGQ